MQNRKKKKDTDLQNSLLDSVGEGEGGMFQENSIETCILSRVKQITSPGWMHETSAWTWCTGKTQRERVEREVGGGVGMGNTCKPMAVSFQCMTKSTTNKKKMKKNQLKKFLIGHNPIQNGQILNRHFKKQILNIHTLGQVFIFIGLVCLKISFSHYIQSFLPLCEQFGVEGNMEIALILIPSPSCSLCP